MDKEGENRIFSLMGRLGEMIGAYKSLPDYSCAELGQHIKIDLQRVKDILYDGCQTPEEVRAAQRSFSHYNQFEAWMQFADSLK